MNIFKILFYLIAKKKKVIRIKEPISYITQSSKEGQLLVTSWDGNIYLFEYPNISYYLEYNKQVKHKIKFNEFFV